MARRFEQDGVGPRARGEPADVIAAPAVAAQTASSGVIPISRTASAMQNGMLVV